MLKRSPPRRSGKPIVLILMRDYLPGFRSGGPIRSIANLVHKLSNDFDFRVVCRDRDAGVNQRYEGITPGTWVAGDGAQICYLTDAEFHPWRLVSALNYLDYDLLYLNSFFDPRFAIAPMLAHWCGLLRACRVLTAPRGEFSLGALEIKRVKKRAFIRGWRYIRHRRGLAFHATSEGEVHDIRRELGDLYPIYLASNIPSLYESAPAKMPDKLPGQLAIVFLSRISPKKNLLESIRVVSRLAGQIKFDIWGPIGDAAYWRRCEDEIGHAPGNVRIQYCGAVGSADVARTLAAYHVFFMPTKGENFGHAIFEALANGLPVVISDQTPWRDLEGWGVGFTLPADDKPQFERALAHYVDMDADSFRAARNACIRYAREWVEARDLQAASRSMFASALGDWQG